MRSLFEMMEAITKFYHVLIKPKEKGPSNKKVKDAFYIVRVTVKYFLQNFSEITKAFLEISCIS